MDDFALLEEWRGGDTRAGNDLFERHFDAVHRFFSNKAPSDAADLVQRTFLGCVEAKERFRAQSSFRTFLFAIAHHELLGHWRRTKKRAVDTSVSSLLDLEPSPSQLLARVGEERRLLEALRSIPMDLQIALELFYWEGLSGPEIAAVVGAPEGTVRSRLRRGLEALRARLDELDRSPGRLATSLAGLDGWTRSIGEALLGVNASPP
ncbi:MAG: sigma-70 family RNA polymerase sigma factor [Polyangiaceae bacterium]|nr:sigma-70 family RNA polymerase sigma factor [Polyangiaceae bacterium]